MRERFLGPAFGYVVLALLTSGLLAACSNGKPAGATDKSAAAGGPPAAGKGGAPRGPSAFPVEVAPVAEANVEFALRAVGAVAAFEEVQITARVAGVVEQVDFAEGQTVTADAVLASIEPRRFQVALAQAKAQLQRAQASRSDAQKTLQRQEQLGKEVGTGAEIDAARAKLDLALADIAAAKAAVDLAQLNLRDARVRAGLAGVIQSRKVATGQYVTPGSVLATILRTEPLLLQFSVPEGDAQQLTHGMPLHFQAPAAGNASRNAVIQHVSQVADATSRMVQVLARIEPPDPALRPGAFAQVAVAIAPPKAVPVVPQMAVRPSEKGFLAYVIEGDVAKERVLELGMRTEDGRVEVKSGVKPGESLVVIGAEALREGAKVRVVPAKPAPGGKDKPASGDVTPPAVSRPASGGKP